MAMCDVMAVQHDNLPHTVPAEPVGTFQGVVPGVRVPTP